MTRVVGVFAATTAALCAWTGCGPSVGDPEAGPASAGRAGEEAARASPAEIGPAEEDDGARLTYVQPAAPGAGTIYDVCTDEEAIAAGLDGGRLDAERQRLGVDCASDVVSNARYLFLDHGGQAHDVGDMRRDDGTFDLPEEQERTWMRPPPGVLLGSSLSGATDGDVPPPGEVAVVAQSVRQRGDALLGVVANGSSRYQASIVIDVESDGGRAVARGSVPFTLMAGEQAPFEIDLPPGTGGTLTASVARHSVVGLPSERSMYVESPGCWTPSGDEDISDYPGQYPVSDSLTPERDAQGVCGGTVELTPASQIDDTELAIRQPRLRIATFGSDGALLAVADVPVTRYGENGAARSITSQVSGAFTNYYVPVGTTSIELWAWGDRP